MGLDHVLDHVPDRERLTLAALAVTALKPVEAASRVVGALLLGEEQAEPEAVRQGRPAGAQIVLSCGLEAAVEHHDQGRRAWQWIGHIGVHAQAAGVGAKLDNLL